MTQYKSYAKEGTFSQFQIAVPDQTKKIRRQTQTNLANLENAEKFRRDSAAIYLEAQKFVQGQEELNRQTNFDLENKERDSYRKALQRDYNTRIANLEGESQAQERQFQQISAFSKTAVEVFGRIQEDREKKKRLAAMDVFARTGATMKDMLAFQKLDDKLTREEFAAQDAVQKMVGPNGNADLVDGFFQIYRNRNTKRWIGHKQLLQNTTNKYPEFVNQIVFEAQQQGPIEDIDALLSSARRRFLEVNFIDDRVRPEVLQGAGVFTALSQTNSAFKNQLLQDKRTRQAAELKSDRMTTFADVRFREGLVGLLRANSENPSFEKRSHFAEFVVADLTNPSQNGLTAQQAETMINMAGGGPNGQSFAQAFDGSPELNRINAGIDARRKLDAEAVRAEEQRLSNERNSFVIDRANQLGLDEDGFTLSDARQIEDEFVAKYPLQTNTNLERLRNITNEGKMAAQTKRYQDMMASKGLFTMEMANNGVYINGDDRKFAVDLATAQERLRKDPITQSHLTEIEDVVLEPREVQVAYSAKTNTYNIQRAQDRFKAAYRERLERYSTTMTLGDAQEKALLQTLAEIQKAQTKIKLGRYAGFDREVGDYDTNIDKQVEQKLLKVDKIIGQQGPLNYERLASEMDQEQITQYVNTALTPGSRVPEIVRYVGERTGQTPFQVLGGLVPYIGDGSLQLKTDNLTKGQIVQLAGWNPPQFKRLANTYRSPQRTGRSNVARQMSGNTAPIRFGVVQYVSGDPAIKGKSNGRIVYDAVGHGGMNYHNHYEFETQADAFEAKRLFESHGYRVTSDWRPNDTDSAHSYGVAIDVAPPLDLPYTPEAEAAWSAAANRLIGFDPNE